MNSEGLNATKKHGRYWIRTSDPFRVKEVRYHCANRPHPLILNHDQLTTVSGARFNSLV